MVWREINKIYKEFIKEFYVENTWLADCAKSRSHLTKSRLISAIVWCGLKKSLEILKNHSFELLYGFFSFITHFYLIIIAVFFFFQEYFPESIINLADSLSEPYLGIIGIYLVLKEVGIRVGKPIHTGVWREALVASWAVLLVISSLMTFISQSYHVDEVYRLILTNSLASVIIRLGTLFKY